MLVTAFPSPRTVTTSQRPPSQGQRSRPATSLPASSASLPVRPVCSITFAGSPRSMATSMRLARCSSASRLDRPLPLPPLPFRTLTSFRIEVSPSSAARQLAFRLRPISSRSPTPVLFLGLASDHRSWSATFPETDCSSNLLEPSPLCAPKPLRVNVFVRRKT